jgi:hypothetical protein
VAHGRLKARSKLLSELQDLRPARVASLEVGLVPGEVDDSRELIVSSRADNLALRNGVGLLLAHARSSR